MLLHIKVHLVDAAPRAHHLCLGILVIVFVAASSGAFDVRDHVQP